MYRAAGRKTLLGGAGPNMRRRALQRVRCLQSWSRTRDEVKLSFQCTGCGKCCTGKGGRVRVNGRELQELAAVTDLSVKEFTQRYTREIQEDVDGHKRTQLVLHQTSDDKQCVFLEGSKCSVYKARPTQCRTFPWWPQNLVSDYDWRLAARDCEGIRVVDDTQVEQDVPAFSFDDVLPETILHDIHRSGENFTYDELTQMLRDLREVDPEFVEQYKTEFVAKFSRKIVFSDDQITVLDSFIESENPTRSFVFNDRLHLTQSEVALSRKRRESFDRSTLALDVHRALCMPLSWLLAWGQEPLRVAVLGAGACALPLFLLEHFPLEKLGHLDAIEPSSVVNAIARRFFGVDAAIQHDPRFVLHEEMGEDFLSEQAQECAFHLMILDVESGESRDGVRAPPLSMIESPFLLTAKKLLVSNGMLAINVITESKEALNGVEARLSEVFPHGLRLTLPNNTVFFAFKEKDSQDVKEYICQIKADGFQTQRAQTPQLLEKYPLSMWRSEDAR